MPSGVLRPVWNERRAAMILPPTCSRPMRILVVDDDSPTRELLARSLGRAGHVASVAANCQEAEAMARGEHFDVLVLDVMLPDGSGLDLCRDLRQQHVKTPILLLTAQGAVGDRVEG